MTTADSRREGRQPIRFEKNRNIAAAYPPGLCLDRGVFDGDIAALGGAHVEELNLVDVEVGRENLANLRAPGGRLTRVTFDGTRLTGLVLNDARLTDVKFAGCRIDLASFGGSGLERVIFEDCLLAQTDFLESRLKGVRFERCDMRRADLRGARMRDCVLRGCTLDELLGVEALRGAKLPWADIVTQAGLFAGALGIELLDED